MGNKIWNELSEESKEKIRQEYDSLQELDKKERIYELELIFGKENLSQKPQIKTWDDVVKQYDIAVNIDPVTCQHFDGKIIDRAIATFKIAKLIELGYGGMITDDEWDDTTKEKFIIYQYENGLHYAESFGCVKEILSFHTKGNRDEFLKYNVQLCKDYYMI